MWHCRAVYVAVTHVDVSYLNNWMSTCKKYTVSSSDFSVCTCQRRPVRIRLTGRCSLEGWWCVWWAGACWAGWTGRTPSSPVWSRRYRHLTPQRSDQHPAPPQSHCKCRSDALEWEKLSQRLHTYWFQKVYFRLTYSCISSVWIWACTLFDM